jgi:hypothetical protein
MRVVAFALAAFIVSPGLAWADCTSDVSAIMEMQKTTSYRVEMTSEGAGAVTKTTADVVPPDRFHVKAQGMEMIMADGKAWMKMGGAWQQMPGEMAATMSQMINSGMDQGIAGLKNVSCLGSQDYEGESFETYSFETSGELSGISSKARVTMYVDDGNMPAWMVIDGEAMGMKSKTVQKITVDPSIEIKAPM